MPRHYSHGGRVARGEARPMPGGASLPNSRSLKERVGLAKLSQGHANSKSNPRARPVMARSRDAARRLRRPLTGVLRSRIGQRREDRSRQASLEAPRPWVLLSGLTPPVFYYLGGFPFVGDYAPDNPVYRVAASPRLSASAATASGSTSDRGASSKASAP
jgi:hypothetical protein